MDFCFLFLLFKPEPIASWLAPYLLGLVFLGILLYIFRVFENWYSKRYNKPLYKHLLVYKKLEESQLRILEDEFPFYQNLSQKHQRQFQHRLTNFMSKKNFSGRDGLAITEQVKVLIGANACMLSFGRKNYMYKLVDFIIVFPDEFSSGLTNELRKVEFNPKEKALVLSWKHFVENQSGNKRNLVIFQFMQAMQLETRVRSDIDSQRFERHYQNILRHLTEPGIKKNLEDGILKEYPFTNEFEFMAVLAECFFESPTLFKTQSPNLYEHVKHVLGFDFTHY